MFDCYINESILKRAQKKRLVKFEIVNIRDFATDKHKTVDDSPYGGGPGMIMKIEPIANALGSIFKIKNQKSKIKNKVRIILLSPKGKIFNQKMAQKLSKYTHLVFICGRYEGVDERVGKHLADEEISIGNYVLTGGELPAMVVIDAVLRHIKGVLGKEESLEEKRFGVGVPVYTRPEIFVLKGRKYSVPKVLLSGDHKKIAAWRARKALKEEKI